jgi:drug/metabolite transporter (DMT)-like permease
LDPFALGLVLGAAILHASWNAMVRGSGDRGATLAGVAGSHALVGLGMILLAPLPARESWGPLAVSVIVHYAYYVLLFQAYRLGDLSLVYPVSRGLSPLLVAVSAAILIGETLTPGGWAGLAAISGGILLLAAQARGAAASRAAVLVALVLGVSIAVYSVSDGIGIRASGTPLGYIGWLFLLEFPIPVAIWLLRARARRAVPRRGTIIGLAGGVFSVAAYGLVLYANTLAPLGAVSAIRESSVIIAALIGVLVFGERPWKGRVVAAALVAAGVIAFARAG